MYETEKTLWEMVQEMAQVFGCPLGDGMLEVEGETLRTAITHLMEHHDEDVKFGAVEWDTELTAILDA